MTEWPLGPLFPASRLPRRRICVPTNTRHPLMDCARLRADGGPSDRETNECAIVGEYGVAEGVYSLLFETHPARNWADGPEDLLNTDIYPEGVGDGGVDLDLGWATIDVKTAK